MPSPQPVRASRRHPVPPDQLTYEPTERWVRGTIGDTTVVDSRRAVLVWEPGQAVPAYAFPGEDVRTDLLVPAAEAGWYDLELGGRRYRQLVRTWPAAELDGLLTFDWFRREEPGVEHWYEEAEEVFVHPRDPYKRVDAIPSSRHVVVRVDGHVVADTVRPVLVFETRLPVRYYIPPADVDVSPLAESELVTRCPYKGTARYWSVGGRDIVWSYPDPLAAVGAIAGLMAFYNEVVDIEVDGVAQERPHSEFSSALGQH